MVERGQTFTITRSFGVDDVRAFARLTGDNGRHHVDVDGAGRLMVHGLLTASLPTALGGSIHFIARVMRFEFVRAVWTGDVVTCTMTITEATPEPEHARLRVAMDVVCVNDAGKEVLRGGGEGVILDRP